MMKGPRSSPCTRRGANTRTALRALLLLVAPFSQLHTCAADQRNVTDSFLSPAQSIGASGFKVYFSEKNQDGRYATPTATERRLIIGGNAAQRNEYPYFVHMGGCGGTLIAPNLVLSAGHCRKDNINDYPPIQVGRWDYRSHANDDVEVFRVVDHFRHDHYDGTKCCGYYGRRKFTGVSYDFLILKLNGDSTMPTMRLNGNTHVPKRREELYVIGFGDTDWHPDKYSSPRRLQEVSVFSLPNSDCVSSSIYPTELIDDSTICAIDFRQDACNGDSGGPLLIKGATPKDDVQVGIVSWGWGCATSQPGVYARISTGYRWIRKIMTWHSSSEVSAPIRPPDNPAPILDKPKDPPQESEEDMVVDGEDVSGEKDVPNTDVEPDRDPVMELLPEQDPVPELFPDEEQPQPIAMPEPTADDLPKWPEQVQLASGLGCSDLKSRHSCCFAKDGTYRGKPGDMYQGQDCLPSLSSHNYASGNMCEARGWVEKNDRRSHDVNLCDAMLRNKATVDTCTQIQDATACCKSVDRDGNPCLFARRRRGFKTGNLCESSARVSRYFPNDAVECSAVRSVFHELD